MWAVFKLAAEDHVSPINDLREHTKSSTCRCMPMACPWQGKVIWVHHTWDGREITEGARILANGVAGRN